MILALLLAVAPAAAQTDDSPAPIRIELNHDQFRRGDRARVYVEAERDGHLVVLHADPDGRVRVLFPLDPTDDDFVRGGRRREIRGRSDRDAFYVDGDDGSGTVLAALSTEPLNYDAFVRNDHWDYRGLGAGSLRDDPLAGLLDLVQRMAGAARFEYDAATYVVGLSVASRYGYGGYGYGAYGFGYPYRYRFGLSFGYPYRFGYYYDPFYDPFCYDPLWSWSASCYPFGFGYSSYYYYRPYVYGRTYLGGGFVSRGGTRYVIPRDRVRTGVQPRSRVGSADGGVAPRRVEPRTRERVEPRTRQRSADPAPAARGRSSGSGNRPSVSRGSSGGSRPASRPANGGSGGRRRP